MKNNKGYIYKIIAPNSKIYIGQTIDPNRRKTDYKKLRFKGQIKLWNSCQKYNWNPIDTFEIVDECNINCRKLLDILEKYWIKKYDTFNNGLNCTNGGCGTHKSGHQRSTKLRPKISEETRKRMSIAQKGLKKKSSNRRPLSEETKLKISIANQERKTSEETRKKISAAGIGRKASQKTKNKMSLSHIGHVVSDEQIIKFVKTRKEKDNYKQSEETKEKLRQKNLGKKYQNRKKPSGEALERIKKAQQERRLRESSCIITQ